MQLKESARSLRAYFFVSGIIALLGQLFLWRHQGVGNLVHLLVSLVGLAIAACFVYVALAFRTLIRTSPGRIAGVLYASIGYHIGYYLLTSAMGVKPNPIVPFVGTMVDLYLLYSVQRISAGGED